MRFQEQNGNDRRLTGAAEGEGGFLLCLDLVSHLLHRWPSRTPRSRPPGLTGGDSNTNQEKRFPITPSRDYTRLEDRNQHICPTSSHASSCFPHMQKTYKLRLKSHRNVKNISPLIKVSLHNSGFIFKQIVKSHFMIKKSSLRWVRKACGAAAPLQWTSEVTDPKVQI